MARRRLLLHWKSTKVPSITQWLNNTMSFLKLEKIRYSVKDDIEIIFRRGSWKANGEFAQTDVHRQIAIVFKTPPYKDQDITEEVEVNLALRRISDQMESEPITFKYLPRNPDVVFFIYLYQRWIYRADPNRVNEFGTSGVDHAQNTAAPAQDAASAAITDKPEGEKKND